jgi:hypothetical protein
VVARTDVDAEPARCALRWQRPSGRSIYLLLHTGRLDLFMTKEQEFEGLSHQDDGADGFGAEWTCAGTDRSTT